MIDLLGWAGNCGFLYGAWALASRRVSGWWAQIWANTLYAIQAYIMNNTPLLTVSIILIGVNLYGLYTWTRKPKNINVNQHEFKFEDFVYDKKRHEFSFKNHAEHSYLIKSMKYYDKD